MNGDLREENRLLRQEVAELDGVVEKLSSILRRISIEVFGPEPESSRWGCHGRWSWHDLPDAVAKLRVRADLAWVEAMRKTQSEPQER